MTVKMVAPASTILNVSVHVSWKDPSMGRLEYCSVT